MPIGIFDSGVGGLTVLEEIHSLLPHEHLIYFGDQANVPYGNKKEDLIKDLSFKIVEFLLEKKCTFLVIACNTMTIAILDQLKDISPVPIIGVVDNGIELSVKSTKTNHIGILATPYSINSKILEQKILQANANIHLTPIAAPLLAEKIEKGWNKNDTPYLKECLDSFPSTVDTILLACTHYPLISQEILSLNPRVRLINPAHATALEVASLLKAPNSSPKKGSIEIFTSGSVDQFTNILQRYFSFSYKIHYHHL